MSAEEWSTHGFAVLHGLLSPEAVRLAHHYYLIKLDNGILNPSPQIANAWTQYADPLSESLLLELQPRIEVVTGLRLLPTYSFARVYLSGSELKRHRDRLPSEITCTMTFGWEGADPWALHLELPEGSLPIPLQPGDVAVLRGMDRTHWREPLTGDRYVQVSVHYVDADGPHASLALDGRARIGAPLVRKARPYELR